MRYTATGADRARATSPLRRLLCQKWPAAIGNTAIESKSKTNGKTAQTGTSSGAGCSAATANDGADSSKARLVRNERTRDIEPPSAVRGQGVRTRGRRLRRQLPF